MIEEPLTEVERRKLIDLVMAAEAERGDPALIDKLSGTETVIVARRAPPGTRAVLAILEASQCAVAIEWRPISEWQLGRDCLICCRGAKPKPEYRGSVSVHYGMASLPVGTVAWAELPEPPPLHFDGHCGANLITVV